MSQMSFMLENTKRFSSVLFTAKSPWWKNNSTTYYFESSATLPIPQLQNDIKSSAPSYISYNLIDDQAEKGQQNNLKVVHYQALKDDDQPNAKSQINHNTHYNNKCWIKRSQALEWGVVDMKSPQLIAYIRENNIIEAPDEYIPYNQRDDRYAFDSDHGLKYYSQVQQDVIVEKILKKKKNGFFIEAGAQNGEAISNTMYFEKHLNWTGLLVEPHSMYYQTLKGKKRNAFSTNVCLSPRNYPLQMSFGEEQYVNDGGQLMLTVIHSQKQCFPLYTLLSSMNPPIEYVDYFSLDIDGLELEVLKSIPWKHIHMSVLTVEYRHEPEPVDYRIKNEMIEYMNSNSFHLYSDNGQDLIFTHKELQM